LLELSAKKMAALIASREISASELVQAQLDQIARMNPQLNAVVELLAHPAKESAARADRQLAASERVGPLHGVPFSVKDSLDVAGSRTTAGTLGRRKAEAAERDATVVARFRGAGAIPIAKTNLPDLLFSFETDNLLFGRTNNPYDLTRTPGGSSGGESALIAACGSPLGLGSDCLGSVRVPAAFCGIASIKPTSGRIPRTGHVPPAGLWFESLWNIGPMARHVEDLQLAVELLAFPDQEDFRALPLPLAEARDLHGLRVAFLTDNGFARCVEPVAAAVRKCAAFLDEAGAHVEERRPPGVEHAYDLELSILGADGAEGIDRYLEAAGSDQTHPLLSSFLSHLRSRRVKSQELARLWTRWDEYRARLHRFFSEYDVILSPVYTQPALEHGHSAIEANFEGFSYTMAWNLAGAPAATVRCGESMNLPINVQIVARPWEDMTALAVASAIEEQFGGWKAP
jgi:amidase